VTRGRLATIGPSPWQTALFAALEVGVPAIAAALALTWYRERAARLETGGASGAAGVPVGEPRASLRERLQLDGERLRMRRIPGFGIARRASGAVLSVLGGFAVGLGLDRLPLGRLRRLRRRKQTTASSEPVAQQPPVVDLVKAERERVSLVKPEQPNATASTVILELPGDAPGKPAKRRRIRRPRLWRPTVPKRLRRKRKVIKLPD
jgi:hypothetical protein